MKIRDMKTKTVSNQPTDMLQNAKHSFEYVISQRRVNDVISQRRVTKTTEVQKSQNLQECECSNQII